MVELVFPALTGRGLVGAAVGVDTQLMAPLPVKPVAQEHEKPPTVFVQMAFVAHGLEVVHSFTSIQAPPVKMYPGTQEHVKLPTVLVQIPWVPQGLKEHSLISVQPIEDLTISVNWLHSQVKSPATFLQSVFGPQTLPPLNSSMSEQVKPSPV